MAIILVDLKKIGPIGGAKFLFANFQSIGNGFPNFANAEPTIVFIDDSLVFSNFQRFSDFLL